MTQKSTVAVTHPHLVLEVLDLDLATVTAGSDKSARWRCALNHEWTALIKKRTAGQGCPYCSGNKVLAGFNDLSTLFPNLALEVDGWDPTTVQPNSNRLQQWKCSQNHRWEAPPKDRTRGDGCPFCSGRRVLIGFNDLTTTHPLLSEQADGWNPEDFTSGSHHKGRWKCALGHTWTASVKDRALRNRGCPFCSGNSLVTGEGDLQILKPLVAAQADGWVPSAYAAFSNRVMPWKCQLGHSWKSSINNRSQGKNCPFCTRKKLLKGFNDLLTSHPEVALQAHGWDPTIVISGSNKKKNWICKKGHTWEASPNIRVKGHGCPFCSNHKVWIGFNDLATTHPDIATEARGWDTSSVTAGSSLNKFTWECSLGHQYRASPKIRTSRKQNCPFCAGKQIIKGFNDLITTHPEIASEANRWNPETVTAGSNKKKQWICFNNHTWMTSPNKRTSGRGCPTCANSGFDPNEKGWLYLVLDEMRGLLQIGISNVPEDRLKTHHKNGFEIVVDIRGPQDGFRVREHETDILRFLKKHGARFANRSDCARFDGWSESWFKDSLDVTSIKQLLDWVYEDEGNSAGMKKTI